MTGRPLSDRDGPNGLPGLGNTHQLWRDPLAFAEQCVHEYGDVTPLSVAGKDAVFLGHPDHVEHVLVDSFDTYGKGEFYRDQFDLFDEGLLISEGETWRRQRERVAPVFRPDRIDTYVETMVRAAESAADRLEPGRPTAIDEELQRVALQVIAESLFSVDIERDVPELREAITVVMEETRRRRRLPFSIPEWLPTPGNRRYDRATETFDDVVAGIIDDHRNGPVSPNDLVSSLLTAREEDAVTARGIRDELLTLLLAGHDTTALGLSYALYLLGSHPEIQADVRDELDRVIGNRSPTVEDLPDLERLDRVIRETLRLYPPVYLLAREPAADDVINGYRIPHGTIVLFSQWTVHRDGRFFEEPDRFDPDRWTESFEKDHHPFAYFPFSGGPRRCIGEQFALMEMRIVLAVLLQRYRFDLAFDPPLDLDPSFSLRPASSIDVVAER